MLSSSSVVRSLLLLPLLARGAPAAWPHSGSSHLPGYIDAGQTLLETTPSGTAVPLVHNFPGGSPNVNLSASSGSIVFFPASPPLAPPPSPQKPLTTKEVKPLVMGYYPDWAGPSFGPDKINFALYDWIDFAFAIPDASFGVTWDSPGSTQKLKELVKAAHEEGTKVKLSIGGWTGSKYFSQAVASKENRGIFAGNINDTYHEFGLDGIDIDWEYPGHEGAGGNKVNPNDSINFLLFLQCLRTMLPPVARLTAAVQTVPFVDASGQPMKDVSRFAEILDWVLIMNYDVWTASSTPGSNAPMNDGCKNSSQPGANAVAAYNTWTSGGFPPSKLVLGLPSYGYVSDSNATNLRSRSSSRVLNHGRHRSLDGGSEEPPSIVKVTGEDGSTVQFRDLVRQGVLVRISSEDTSSSPALYGAAGGYTRFWDACSSTPWLRSTLVEQVITFDDPESLYMKAEFTKKVGMLGVNLFDVHGDTDECDLIRAVRLGLGGG